MMKHSTKHFKDLGYFVVAEPHPYFVDYKIYQVEGVLASYEPIFHRAGSRSYPDPVDTFDESEVYVSGSVRRDGCSNWHFDEQDRAMLHGCTKFDLLNLGKILAECWEMTSDLCPNWLED